MKWLLSLTIAATAAFFALPAAAQTDPCAGNTTSIMCALASQPGLACIKTGSCGSLDSILQVFAIIAQWLLGIAGSVMLLMFVWGGAEWVFSRGESGMVKSGKEKMTNAVIGIVLMFSALAIVRSIQRGLLSSPGSELQIACVIDSDCGTNMVCSAGQCITKQKAAEQQKTLGCSVANDCNENGAKPWMTCIQAPGGNRCGSVCEQQGGSCETNSTGASGGNPCGAGFSTLGEGAGFCGEDTGICCKKL